MFFFFPRAKIDAKISERYQQVKREWKACEVIVKQREKEMQSAIFAKLSSGSSIDSHVLRLVHRDSTLSNEVSSAPQRGNRSVADGSPCCGFLCDPTSLLQVFMSVDEPDAGSQETPSGEDGTPTMTALVAPAAQPPEERPLVEFDSPDSGLPSSRNYSVTSAHSQILSSIDDGQSTEEEGVGGEEGRTPGLLPGGCVGPLTEDRLCSQLDKLLTGGAAAGTVSPSLSSYTVRRARCRLDRESSTCSCRPPCFSVVQIELLDTVALNLHRIDKDVQRCDRNYYYFTPANLEKLRNIMCRCLENYTLKIIIYIYLYLYVYFNIYSMCVFIYVYIFIYTVYVHLFMYINVYIFICMYIFRYICVFILINLCICIYYIYIYMYLYRERNVCIRVCVYKYKYLFIFILMYLFICIYLLI